MIQIDPVSAAVAALALVLSVLSLVQANRAPARARSAALREEIRVVVEGMRERLDAVAEAVRSGRDLPERSSEALHEPFEKLKRIEPRLAGPRHSFEPLGWDLLKLDGVWADVDRAQKDVGHYLRLAEISGDVDVDGAKWAEEGRRDGERRRDAAVIEIREPLRLAQEALATEIAWLDRLDRGALT